ncbi:MAG: adenylate/guanylate cyclase domain-containing protein [Actinomycetota bacterium]|nr:adenylate/guanylate cyclase domain-containing protein [Actinomycetota bacterium]
MDRTVHYARNGDVHLAYQVVGDGPVDLVYAPGIWSNLDVMWEEPRWARFLERLASFSRLILFDMRGIGLSDRGREPPVLELQMDDVRAVMDAAGSERAAVFGGARGAAMTLLFAASYPDRTRWLVLYAPVVRTLRSPDWPYGRTPEEMTAFYERFVAEMGTGANLDLQGPLGLQEPAFVKWWARFERLVASPGDFREIATILGQIDVRRVVPSVQAPTLVLHRTGDIISDVGQGRWIAEHIPDARLVELEGNDHLPFLGDQDAIVDEIQEFLTGVRPAPDSDRVLATVLFTDIVGSTELASTLGDRAWRDRLERHHAVVRGALAQYRGREVDTAGDGFMAAFDGPARAIRCARAIVEGVRELGLEVRAGIHTGECEQMGDRLGGIAVHTAARVAAAAQPGEVLVSGTVRDLVAGSGIRFLDRGEHELKGVPGRWALYRPEG